MQPGAPEGPARSERGPATLVFDLGGVVFRWRPDEFLQRLLPDRAPDAAAARDLTEIGRAHV